MCPWCNLAAWLVPTQRVRVRVLGGMLDWANVRPCNCKSQTCERTNGRGSKQTGSSSNRKTPVSQAGDPGAIPGGSTHQLTNFLSRRLTAKTPGSHPGDGGSIPSGTIRRRRFAVRGPASRSGRQEYAQVRQPGRAARFRSEGLQVRLLLWALDEIAATPPQGQFENALVEQPGVLACLSRRRTSVQIRSGVLSPQLDQLRRDGDNTNNTARCAKGRATGFKHSWLGVRLPPVLLESFKRFEVHPLKKGRQALAS